MEKITGDLIAPCGMDCGVCYARLRLRNPCKGCNQIIADHRKTIMNCFMKNCTRRAGRFCFSCDEFPCEHLKHLDKRYRLKYGMSEIENLNYIREHGLDAFVEHECERWQSTGGTFCVHDKKWYPG